MQPALGEADILRALNEGDVSVPLASAVVAVLRVATTNATAEGRATVATGSVTIAAALLSARRVFGDVDLSCRRSDYQAVCFAINTLVGMNSGGTQLLGVKVSFGVTTNAFTSAATEPQLPPLSACFTGETMTYELADTLTGKKFKVQLSARHDAWSPAQLVGGYYSAHMGVVFGCDSNGNLRGRLSRRATTTLHSGAAVLTPERQLQYLTPCEGITVADAAKVLAEMQRVIEAVVTGQGIGDALPAAAVAAFAAPYAAAGTSARAAQHTALCGGLPALFAAKKNAFVPANFDALAAVRELRRTLPRYLRDATDGGVVFDFQRSRDALARYLRENSAIELLPCDALELARVLGATVRVARRGAAPRFAPAPLAVRRPAFVAPWDPVAAATAPWNVGAAGTAGAFGVAGAASWPGGSGPWNAGEVARPGVARARPPRGPFAGTHAQRNRRRERTAALEAAMRVCVAATPGARMQHLKHGQWYVAEAVIKALHAKRSTAEVLALLRPSLELCAYAEGDTTPVGDALRQCAAGVHKSLSGNPAATARFEACVAHAVEEALHHPLRFAHSVGDVAHALHDLATAKAGSTRTLWLAAIGSGRYAALTRERRADEIAQRRADAAAAVAAATAAEAKAQHVQGTGGDDDSDGDGDDGASLGGASRKRKRAGKGRVKLGKGSATAQKKGRHQVVRKLSVRRLLRNRERDEPILHALVNEMSREAPIYSVLYGTAVERAIVREGPWPFIDLDAPAQGGSPLVSSFANAAVRGHTAGFHCGRARPSRKGNGQIRAANLETHVTTQALEYLASKGVNFDRLYRSKGDTQAIIFEAGMQRAACNRSWGAGAVHGIPMRTLAHLCAAFLRAADDAIVADEASGVEGPEWRASWRSWMKAKKLKSVVFAMRWKVMGLTHFKNAQGIPQPLVITAAVQAVLGEPFVAAIILQHRQWLWGDDTVAEFVSATPAESAQLVLARDDAAIAAYVEECSISRGTWAAFARRLNLAPSKGIRYLAQLLAQREHWIESELHRSDSNYAAWSIRVSGEEHTFDAIQGVDPAAFLVTEGDAEEEDENRGDEGVDEEEHFFEDRDDDDTEDVDDNEPTGASRTTQRGSEAIKRVFRGRAWYPRLFSLVPVCKPKDRHVRIDDSVSFHVFGVSLDQLLKRPTPRTRKGEMFGSSVTTNGLYVSILYSLPGAAPKRGARKVVAAPTSTAPVLGGTRCVGVDLGNINPIAAGERLVCADGSTRTRTTVYNADQWRHDTCQLQREATTHEWCKDLRSPGGAFERLGTVTSKTASLTRFVEYARVLSGTLKECLDERMKPRWAHLKFQAWRLGTRALARAWSSVLSGRLEDGTWGVRTVLGVGDANFPSSGRGRKSTPTTALKKAGLVATAAFGPAQHVTRAVDEFKSTALHSTCKCRLGDVYAHATPRQLKRYADKLALSQQPPRSIIWGQVAQPPPPPRALREWYKLHGLQWCSNPACQEPHKRLVSRDPDASVVIADVLECDVEGKPPPAFLQRGVPRGPAPPRLYLWG